MKSILAHAILAPLTLWNVRAEPPPTPLTFDVASIKPSAPDVQGVSNPMQSGGSFRVAGATLKNLIFFAYNVRTFAISGGPAWIDSDRFDINARTEPSSDSEKSAADPKTKNAQFHERLKSLLADRFQLAVHSEIREQNVYALVIAKNGPKLSEAKPGGIHMIQGRRGSITGQGVAMQLLVTNLSSSLEAPVLDRTGLTSKYDFKLEWTPDTGQAASGVEASDPGPSLFTALQDQLGLRLEAQKAPVKILVIDHAKRPSAN